MAARCSVIIVSEAAAWFSNRPSIAGHDDQGKDAPAEKYHLI